MADRENPKFKVLIKPQFDKDHQAASLDIVLTIESPDLVEGSIIVSFPSVARAKISEDNIKFIDEKGELSTVYRILDSGAGPSWTAGRQTSGDMRLSYCALPSHDNPLKPQEQSLNLYFDHGGLLGSGLIFIPTPPTDKI
jgi:hypothetical protein